jgi:virulence-associated protein VagC
MNLKRLFFWAFIFSVLLGYVLLSEKKPVEKKEIKDNTKLIKVFSFSPDEMQKVEIIQKNKKVILKKISKKWEIVSPEAKQEVRQEAVTSIISAITDTINIEVITDAPEDLTQYGLSSPSTILNIFLDNKDKPVVFLMGGKTPTTISLYAMLKEENTVITIGTFLSSSINSFMYNFK